MLKDELVVGDDEDEWGTWDELRYDVRLVGAQVNFPLWFSGCAFFSIRDDQILNSSLTMETNPVSID